MRISILLKKCIKRRSSRHGLVQIPQLMKLLQTIPTLTVVTFFLCDVVFGAVGYHEAVFKSVNQASSECSLYLRDGTGGRGECSTRCRGLVTRYWNDSLGYPAVTVRKFYQPAPDDSEYYDLTEQCLNEVTEAIPVEDSCRRADCTVQCYVEQYGQLDREAAKFVPFTDLQHERILKECAAILGVSAERMALFAKDGIEHYQDGKCLLRCFMLREGYYSDDEGPHLDRMSLQCQGNYNDEEFRTEARSCVRSLKEQNLDYCTLAQRITHECVNGEFAIQGIFGGVLDGLVQQAVNSLLPSISGSSFPSSPSNLSVSTLAPMSSNLTFPPLPTDVFPEVTTPTFASTGVPLLPITTGAPTTLPPIDNPNIPSGDLSQLFTPIG